MNILFIYEVDYLKKVVYDMHMLAEAMALRGHEVYAIDYESMWTGTKGNGKLDVSRVFGDARVHLVRPNFIRLPLLSRMSAFVTHFFEIGKLIKEKKIEAIVLYSVPTNGLQATFWAQRLNIPILFRSIDAVNELVSPYPLKILTKRMERVVYSRVDKVLTISPNLSEYVKHMGAKKTEVLPLPVDITRFYPFNSTMRNKRGFSYQDKIILFVGTLFEFSGLDRLIRWMPYMLKKIIGAKLLIVGDGGQRLKLQGLVDKLGLRRDVVFTGFQPYEDMAKYINSADVCVLPFQENDITRDIFPGKTVQYLACGKPLVSTKLPGLRAMIEGERQGVLYVDDVSDMPDVILPLLNSPEKCWEIGSRGYDYVRRVHSCSKVAEQLEYAIRGLH